ncbi:DUF523 domain-containing protein [Saccharibacillus sp. CPCC 101409]|uniref:DUF523 domain-containing protein n=1 Tax=Saccharibacillus sp. CPCC 101409 TaxID=3058041 RepID=UPI0026718FF5|nr:DUF523 domain-containing protein [Saccharibacillus sp. CPCC 101409]MDO3413347.1 DUF523 domain-containing protein [Saccharibacillus sp. CPCC 101409]
MILVSSCLAGQTVRYNGTHSLNAGIRAEVEAGRAAAVCPELLGGFVTPREPAEIVGGGGDDVLDGRARVIEISGADVTELYLRGARLTLEKARELGAHTVVLKENSPSCGSAEIYNGAFDGTKAAGHGVTTALLRRHGITVLSEHNYRESLNHSTKGERQA